jgi:hypothetical protein
MQLRQRLETAREDARGLAFQRMKYANELTVKQLDQEVQRLSSNSGEFGLKHWQGIGLSENEICERADSETT